jgi:hypothetical protein
MCWRAWRKRSQAYTRLRALTHYLKRQQDFAASRGFAGWVVEIAIARTLLYQAAGKKMKRSKPLRKR